MCGIAGIAGHVTANEPDDRVRVRHMVAALAHRGPDDDGVFIAPGGDVVLGHRRLSIIDTSPGGHQPMVHQDSGLVVTYNGELYNYRALRDELAGAGQRFHTDSDTEVLLAAWAVWGVAAVERFRGIFAFAMWDPAHDEVTLVRDQLGVKPLYYWWAGHALVFASEVRAILACELRDEELSPRALHSLLAYGSVQDPWTLVDGVRSVPPGHVATWSAGTLRLQRYWHLPRPLAPADVPPAPVSRVADQIAASVQSQLVSDVPIGAFLSGGIDSTAIAAMMASAGAVPRTLSVVFDEPSHDESHWSRLIAERLGTWHTELRLTGDDVRRDLHAALAAYDQPSMDGLNTWFVSRLARQAGLTVALSGLGGDELFAGYDGFARALRAERVANRVGVLPRFMRGALARVAGAFPNEGARKLGQLLTSTLPPYFTSRRLFAPAQVADLLSPDVWRRSNDWEPDEFASLTAFTAPLDPINRASACELSTYLVSTLLRDTDQMAMAHGLEVRVPFLDPDLVSLVFALPGALKFDARTPKALLVRALADKLPPEVVDRPKRGFELPFQHWLQGALRDEMASAFAPKDSAGAWPFNPAGLRALWAAYQQGQVGWARVWTVYVVRDWLARHGLAG